MPQYQTLLAQEYEPALKPTAQTTLTTGQSRQKGEEDPTSCALRQSTDGQ
tara:strand:- start:265 stop:414 length:150 start_codon:yes stop_codon:yes gene_type:complete